METDLENMLKKLSGFGLDLLNKANNIYKGIKQFIKDTIDIIPYGNYINKGLDFANGELFFIVDSDDILPSDSLTLFKTAFTASIRFKKTF